MLKMRYETQWKIETKYRIGDLVEYKSHKYICIKNHKSSIKFNPQKYIKYWNTVIEYTNRQKTQKELKDGIIDRIQENIDFYSNSLQVKDKISIADINKFKNAINSDKITVIIDNSIKTPRVQPSKDGKTATLILPYDPTLKTSGDNITTFHEAMHVIEFLKGTFNNKLNDEDSAEGNAYREYRVEYIIRLIQDYLVRIKNIEYGIKNNKGEKYLLQQWGKTEKSSKNQDILVEEYKIMNPKKDEFIKELNDWFGFDVDPNTIKKFYKSGSGGKEFKQLIENYDLKNLHGFFPQSPFNGMQIEYTLDGVEVTSVKDSEGFTTARYIEGTTKKGEAVSLTGSAMMGGGFSADLSVILSDGVNPDQVVNKNIKSGFPGYNKESFYLELINVHPNATNVSMKIIMDGHYSAGDRGLEVRGSFKVIGDGDIIS